MWLWKTTKFTVHPLSEATKQAAYYCDKSENCIKYLEEATKIYSPDGNSILRKNIKHMRQGNFFLTDFNKCVVRNII